MADAKTLIERAYAAFNERNVDVALAFMTDDVSAKFLEWRRRGVRFRYTPRLRRVK